MSEVNLPQVGAAFTFKGERVLAEAVRKLGRGYQVAYTSLETPECEVNHYARLADWNKGAVKL